MAALDEPSDASSFRPGSRHGGTLDAGLGILEALAVSPAAGVGVTDLARQIGLDKGNAHRLLQVLSARGYAEQDSLTRRWKASAELVSLASGVLRNLDARAAAEPALHTLVMRTAETAHLAVRTSFGGVYVAQERPTGRMSAETELGSHAVLHATATGKALIADLDRDQWESLIEKPMRGFTSRTHTTAAKLDDDLRRTRARGFALDDEEYQWGIRCVAAAISDHRGKVVGSIGVSGPTERIPRNRVTELGNEVLSVAQEVTAALGGSPTTMVPGEVRERPNRAHC